MEEYFKRLTDGPPFANNEDMKYEFRRLVSFQNWPSNSSAYPIKLAKAGFFYNGSGDEVECFKCGVKRSGWTPLDDPVREHRALNPDCPLLGDNCDNNDNNDNDNVPIHVINTCPRNSELTKIINLGSRLDCLLRVNDNEDNAAEASGRLADVSNATGDANVSTAAENAGHAEGNGNNIHNSLDNISKTAPSIPATSPSLSDQQSIQRSRSLGNLQTNFRQSVPENVCIDKRSSTFPETSTSRDNASNFANHTAGASSSGEGQSQSGVAQGQSGGAQGHSGEGQSQSGVAQGQSGGAQGHSGEGQSSKGPGHSGGTQGHGNGAQGHSGRGQGHSGGAQGFNGVEHSRGTGAKPKEDRKKEKQAKKSKEKKDKKSGKSSKDTSRRDSNTGTGSNAGPQTGYDIPPPSGESIGPLRFERNRLETFSTWPSNACVPANELAKCGFFYTDSGDRVQCIFCKGILRNWEEGDRPHIEHRKHFPRCPLVLGMKIGNVPLPVNQNQSFGAFSSTPNSTATQTNLNPGDNAAENVADTFNMETLGIVTDRPKNPQYAIESQRLASFKGWPQYKHQTPQQIAEAGFWYAGFNDNVKCFYCDGGLRNWEPGDVPWEEHAHWFPKCPFVIQVKGQEFINAVLRAKGGEVTVPVLANAQRSAEGSEHSGRSMVEEREVRARMDSPYIKKVLDMGVSKQVIMNTIRKRMQETGDDFPSATALMEAVFREDSNEQSQNPPSVTQNASDNQTGSEDSRQNGNQSQNDNQSIENTEPVPEVEDKVEQKKPNGEKTEQKDQEATGCAGNSVQADDLMKENLELKEQRLCKICMVSDANVVFLPCGHLVSCASCAPALQMCPICRATIKGTVRTYIA